MQFKKVKKKKLRKKVRVKADDLLPLGNEDDDIKNHGSRNHGSRRSGFRCHYVYNEKKSVQLRIIPLSTPSIT